ncbi:MAG: hypothetical protein V1776_02105 [Candidatus Diapherotrites archaeon]
MARRIVSKWQERYTLLPSERLDRTVRQQMTRAMHEQGKQSLLEKLHQPPKWFGKPKQISFTKRKTVPAEYEIIDNVLGPSKKTQTGQ